MPTECERGVNAAIQPPTPLSTTATTAETSTDIPIATTAATTTTDTDFIIESFKDTTNATSSMDLNGEMSTSQTSNASSTATENGHNGSSSNVGGGGKKTSITTPDPTAYVTKARVTRPTPPPPSYNPMQFVQIKPCSLYQTAQEQLKKAEEVKKIKEVKKEEPEDWQNNLDNWKSSRRKRVEHIIDRVVEVKKLELEEHDRSRRKSKTFSEMIEERGERGGNRGLTKLASLTVYTEDEANDFSDLGIGNSSASGKSSLSEDYDNNSVMSDNVELEKAIRDNGNHHKANSSTTREYISSPGYDTSSSTAPASSPDPCEYTYEGAIQDYKQRVSRATSGTANTTTATATATTTSLASGNTPYKLPLGNGLAVKTSSSKDSTPERPNINSNSNGISNGDSTTAYPVRRGSKIEDRLIGFEVTSPSDSQEGAEKQKVDVPKIDISKRKEIFESQNANANGNVNEPKSTGVSTAVPRVTLRDRFKLDTSAVTGAATVGASEAQEAVKKEVKRLSGDITSIRDRLQSLEQSAANQTNGTKLVDIPVAPLKDRLSSLQNAVTKEEVKKPPVALVDARQLEIMKSEEQKHIKQLGTGQTTMPTVAAASVVEQKSATSATEVSGDGLDVDRDDSGIHTSDDIDVEDRVATERIKQEQEQQLNAAIAALAMEERQLEEAANAVNQIEAEFAELSSSASVALPPLISNTNNNTSSNSNTNSIETQPCEMEFSINEALELALEAIDKEGKATTVLHIEQIESIKTSQQHQQQQQQQIITNSKQMQVNKRNNQNQNETQIQIQIQNKTDEEKKKLLQTKIQQQPQHQHQQQTQTNIIARETNNTRVMKQDNNEEIEEDDDEDEVQHQQQQQQQQQQEQDIVESKISKEPIYENITEAMAATTLTTTTTTTMPTTTASSAGAFEIETQIIPNIMHDSSNINDNNKSNNNTIINMQISSTNTTTNITTTKTTTNTTNTSITATTNNTTETTTATVINNNNSKNIKSAITTATNNSSNNNSTKADKDVDDDVDGSVTAVKTKHLEAIETALTTPTATATAPATTIATTQQQQQQQQQTVTEMPVTAEIELEPYYQVPKSSEPYYDAPKHLRPVPVYENIDMFYTGEHTALTLMPPKEKPPPPPAESPPLFDDGESVDNNTDTWSSDNTYETISSRRMPLNSIANANGSLTGEHPSPPIKRMNSTKRIKKELRNKRSSFLGIEGSVDDDESYLELTVAPPPDMAQLLEEERRLEKQLYIKAGLCDSSDTGESRDSGVSENHSRQSSEHYTNSSEENDTRIESPLLGMSSSQQISPPPPTQPELIYQNEALLTAAQTPLLQTVKGNSAESWTESATVAAAASKSLTEATATANAKMQSIEEKIREQEEVLRVERELLQLEQEELKRQRENLMLRENMARRELQHGAKMLMSANRHSLQDLNGLAVAPSALVNGNSGGNSAFHQPQSHGHAHAQILAAQQHSHALGLPYGHQVPPPAPQQIYANVPNLQPQFYQVVETDYRKSMSDLNEFSKRLMLPPTPPTKPMRAMQSATTANGLMNTQQFGGSLVKIATQPLPTAAPRSHHYNGSGALSNGANFHHQSTQNLNGNMIGPHTNGLNPLQPGNMSRNTLHALSATPKPKYTDGWVHVQSRKSYESNALANDPAWLSAYQQKRKSMPEAYHVYNSSISSINNNNTNNNSNNTNNHWLVQEAEQRRLLEQQRRSISTGNTPIHQSSGKKTSVSNSSASSAIQLSSSAVNGNGKPLPDAIIQSLTERVQSKGIGERKRFDNYNNNVDKSPLHAAAYQQQQQQQQQQQHLQYQSNLAYRSNHYKHQQQEPTIPPLPPTAAITSPAGSAAATTTATTTTSTPSSNTNTTQDKVLSVSGKKKCSHCGDELGRGAAMIIESLLLFYHINCFKCCVCHVQLGDGLNGTDVRVRNHKLHCQNCYSSDDGIKFSCV